MAAKRADSRGLTVERISNESVSRSSVFALGEDLEELRRENRSTSFIVALLMLHPEVEIYLSLKFIAEALLVFVIIKITFSKTSPPARQEEGASLKA
ncbi:hypothetical protein DNTS_005175 [Danionella cerebrum]|uniref:Uncharacterized protein n=1 Tax=Danionella cerebrum TaxID=2873325 RepID=A0A553QEY6_9TELE|nr:hypothetical protein DNTS_005175 [Danionella translucida]